MIRVFGEYAQECSQRGDDDKAMWGLVFQSDVLDVSFGKSALEFYSTPFIFPLELKFTTSATSDRKVYEGHTFLGAVKTDKSG